MTWYMTCFGRRPIPGNALIIQSSLPPLKSNDPCHDREMTFLHSGELKSELKDESSSSSAAVAARQEDDDESDMNRSVSDELKTMKTMSISEDAHIDEEDDLDSIIEAIRAKKKAKINRTISTHNIVIK